MPLQSFFWSTNLRRDLQRLPFEGNTSAFKASKMTFLRQLLAHEILKKSWMTFSILTKQEN